MGEEEDFFMGKSSSQQGARARPGRGERPEDERSLMWSRSGQAGGKGLQSKEQPGLGDENPCNGGEVLSRDHVGMGCRECPGRAAATWGV